MMMKISQLKAGLRICEHKNNGDVQHFEVVKVQPAGRRVEVTFRSGNGMESALYQRMPICTRPEQTRHDS